MTTHARRNSAVKATLLVAFAVATASFTGCQKQGSQDPELGSASMAIMLPDGSSINAVSYRITGNGITPITGTVNVTASGATVSFLVGGIPTGNGYTVALEATSTDGNTHCMGSSTFNIIGGQVTRVTVFLRCTGGNTGSVVVNGIFCPRPASFTVNPLTTGVNSTIDVAATANDFDTNDNVTPTFAWTATAGTFASAAAASTTYTCSVPGTQTITLTVGGTSPTLDVSACGESLSVDVTCVALACGNGTLDPGEECDPPDGTTCDASCRFIPVCGNGRIEAGEQCDPPNGTTCDAQCRNIPVVCGDGIVQPGEDCEPPNTATCDATCHNIGPIECGNGIVESGEDCEPPNTPAGNFTPACNATCHFGQTLCEACEATKCDGLFGDPTAWGCQNAATPAARAACESVLSCVRTTHCATGARGNQDCYCGTASDLGCLSGQANGACKTVYETADGTTDPATIAQDFVDPNKAIGLANNQLTCDADTTTPPSCTAVCPL